MQICETTGAKKFSWFVTDHAKNKSKFRIQEHETQAEMWVDLEKSNYWEYTKPPDAGGLSLYSTGFPSV